MMRYFLAMIVTLVAIAFLLSGMWLPALVLGLVTLMVVS